MLPVNALAGYAVFADDPMCRILTTLTGLHQAAKVAASRLISGYQFPQAVGLREYPA